MTSSRPWRRRWAALGPIEVVEVISHDPAAVPEASIQGARMADPLPTRTPRADPMERQQAQALDLLNRSSSAGGFRLAPPAGAARSSLAASTRQIWSVARYGVVEPGTRNAADGAGAPS
jgi:hypothetical protein